MKIALKTVRAWMRDPRQFSVKSPDRHCPICDYTGRFHALGTPPRWDGRCPNCGSRERHRLIHLFLTREGIDLKDGRTILHFAPEAYFVKDMAGNAAYHTADLVPGKARHAMDMADMKLFEDASVDVVIANHVLEHVPDDRKAMRESFRVLKPGGFALYTVPQNWAREETYENPALTTKAERYAHYLDESHLRYYGRDFPERVREAGFTVEAWRLPAEDEAGYGLAKEDVLWIARKPG
ncbi:methyltransferase domain-containing protein [Hyphobacterium marinum]|uniref:Methyltransferase domain-containing protein n=1 Tax=Hyphobacterium marinum TaxID=3116574 RepID=A0ABU7LVG6_9PROT|nr:methyltransferase domain-containing protein [Hyphobacterium sp. Y6023]MEE2565524.1 methyltransferase domain-containing protein [Hyphobacterium sp. Y6023]